MFFQLAQVTGVARKIKKKSIFDLKNRYLKKISYPMLLPGHLWVPSKNISPSCPAVWPAITDIYIYIWAKSFIIYRFRIRLSVGIGLNLWPSCYDLRIFLIEILKNFKKQKKIIFNYFIPKRLGLSQTLEHFETILYFW